MGPRRKDTGLSWDRHLRHRCEDMHCGESSYAVLSCRTKHARSTLTMACADAVNADCLRSGEVR